MIYLRTEPSFFSNILKSITDKTSFIALKKVNFLNKEKKKEKKAKPFFNFGGVQYLVKKEDKAKE